MNKIIIAGGTGFIGKYLEEKFCDLGYDVLMISRQAKHINWDEKSRIIEALNEAIMLVNLAGKSVDCRYNQKNRKEILLSRTETTKALGEAIQQCRNPPSLWINASTATIYRHAEDRPMSEVSGEIGSGFSVKVAKSWEQTFFNFKLENTRQIALRMAIVLGKDGGVIRPFKNLARFGLGGKQGSGNQMFSWLHIEDLFQIILFLQQHKELQGVFNCSVPNPIQNKDFMHTLRNTMGIRFGLTSPRWLLEVGARLIQTEVELILKSRWVIPERLLKSGFIFKYPTIEKALINILH